MGRRPRNAVSLKQIGVIVGDQYIVFPLDKFERLEDRKIAKMRVRQLKERADEIIKSTQSSVMMLPEETANLPMDLSIQHIEILQLEDMSRPIEGKWKSSCVSFMNGVYDIAI